MTDTTNITETWRELRQRKPLVLCITNRVTTQRVADTLLAAGASPVMADHPEEVPQMLAIADVLYLNAGLHASQPAALRAAAEALRHTPRPTVLDPVGAGATAFRNAHMAELLKLPLSVIRGNASEIRALAREEGGTKGVDASHGSDQARDAAWSLHHDLGCTVAVSGERDLIVGPGEAWVEGGHPWLTQVTGAGCALGALVAAYCAVAPAFDAAVAAHQAYAHAAQVAHESEGPGTFSVRFLDRLNQVGTR